MIVGTAGHIDHGKTSLVRKLTGVDTDRLKEEKARGISIDLGLCLLAAPRRGDHRLRRCAGPRGPGAQHAGRRHRHRFRDPGRSPPTTASCRRRASTWPSWTCWACEHGVVALNKCDLVGEDRLAEVTRDVEAVLAGTGLEGAEIVPVSAVTGEGLPELTARLDAALAHDHARVRRTGCSAWPSTARSRWPASARP